MEGSLEVELPADYREFLLQYNGGYFDEPDIAPPDAACPLDRLTFLCGIGAPGEFAELGSPEGIGCFDDNQPCQILPIGYTLMGNMILLITHPEDNGQIALAKAFSDDTFFLAEGIEGFFAFCKSLKKSNSWEIPISLHGLAIATRASGAAASGTDYNLISVPP